MSNPPGPPVPMEEGVNQWLRAHLATIEQRIRKQAETLAKAEGRDDIEPKDIAQAAQLYAPGELFTAPPRERLTLKEKVLSSISGITLISALLAIAFGIIGYAAAAKGSEITSGAWDIAKIFAGAVVGSTGAAVSTAVKRD
ncbi:MAG TPA: hypothetical protein VF240_17255 [Pyrinomonadaceae bacterium]